MKLRVYNRDDWKRLGAYLRSLPWQRAKLDCDGKPVMNEAGEPVMDGIQYRVTVEELKPTRSTEQNSRLWALYTAISQQAPQHMGGEYHSPDVWHVYLAGRFLGMVPGPYGTGVRKSTADLKVMEFSDYMTQIEAWAIDQFPGFDFEWKEAA